ncbi:MAG: TIGR03960 family B12-binding radical SAM protein [Deltaproteobacteria bacterium]|nr:TIGR03960 family B12-binding radical SAM protein [Deltaproteobacteria bacterium]
MIRQTFNDILPLVQQPSRYLGSETYAIRKDPEKIRLRFALVFPDLYDIGMSYLGSKILYHILNSKKEIAAERVFVPGEDMEAQMRAQGVPLLSLETRTPLAEFDIIGVSLLYELSYTSILTILDLAGIPFYAKERNSSHPIVIAGGPCAFNPEPVADFFDAIVVGDGEEVICELTDVWMEWKKSGQDREALLKRWSEINGVYVPSLFESATDANGFQVLTPLHSGYDVVKKRLVSDLNQVSFPDHPVIPFGNPVHDRLSLEVARGCTRGCRFCQAGMIYRPVRERSPENLLDLTDRALSATGYEDLSLLSLSTGDYGSILPLLQSLMMRCEPEKTAVSLPSLRVETLTPELMEQIKKVRKTGFTVAVEAGSQRLRNVINKNNTEQDLLDAVENAFKLGWNVIKLYFMIGLPTETEEDIEEIVSLVRRLQRIKGPAKRRGSINVSVSTFIPKPHTPFQWSPQLSMAESDARLRWLREKLQGRKIKFKWHNPKMSILEGLFARGDRRLSNLLVNAYGLGCRLDGWSDRLRYDLWEKAIEQSNVEIDFYTTRTRSLDEPLPWDHIDSMVTKDYLKDEWHKALQQASTADCRTGECNLCGVCDHADIKPVTFHEDEINHHRIEEKGGKVQDAQAYKKLRVSYSKRGEAKYFSHLELMQIFKRAFRRARIPLKYSEGFHPMPKISFETALPVGIESVEEQLVVTVDAKASPSPETLKMRLNRELPDGITILDCIPYSRSSTDEAGGTISYTVQLKKERFPETALKSFLDQDTWPITKTNRKGKSKEIDLRTVIKSFKLTAPDTLIMTVNGGPGQVVRPREVIASIFGLPEDVLKRADIVKYNKI